MSGSKPHADRPPSIDKSPGRIAGMFDAIARRYDLLNGVLSAGLDRRWRRTAVRALQLTGREAVLDLCTGTADLALALNGPGGAKEVIGVDFAAEMLRYGQEKTRHAARGGRIQLVRGDAMAVPVGSASVDAVTIGFGLRNTQEPAQTLREVHRVLRPGGRLAILEFGEPRRQPLRGVYRWYFRRVLPLIGRLVSRHETAYEYLPASVGAFPAPPALCRLLSEAGFAPVEARPLTFGIVYLYAARKPVDSAGHGADRGEP